MSGIVDGDDLRRLGDVVDALEPTSIDVDSVQLLESTDDAIRGQLTVTVPDDVGVEFVATDTERSEPDLIDERESGEPDDECVDELDGEDEDSEDNDEVWCGTCGYGPSSEIGVRRHHGIAHEGEASVVSDRPGDVDDQDDDSDETKDDLPADRVFAELVQMAENDGYEWVKASDLAKRFDTTGQKVAYRLKNLRSEDRVEKFNENAAVAVWRPIKDGTSTEDDTTSESASLSEAQDVDLAEDATDDAPTGTGDDVQDEPVAEEITVDGVNDDGSDADVALPDGITPDDVEAAVNSDPYLDSIGNELGVTTGRARTITVSLGLYGNVREGSRGSRE